jgi:hypothetical protein
MMKVRWGSAARTRALDADPTTSPQFHLHAVRPACCPLLMTHATDSLALPPWVRAPRLSVSMMRNDKARHRDGTQIQMCMTKGIA